MRTQRHESNAVFIDLPVISLCYDQKQRDRFEVVMGLPLRDSQYHSYGEYRTWPEDVRYELINGVAYAMSPAPVRLHQRQRFPAKCKVTA